MIRPLFISAVAFGLAGCGMGTEGAPATSATETDALYRQQFQPAEVPLEIERGEWCQDEIIRPQITATLQELVQDRTRAVLTELGDVVQSSYLNTNGANEEIRKGIAEFKVEGDFRRALLRFKESRTVWPYPVPTDTHRISLYDADFKASIGDFDAVAVGAVRFETDVNSMPADNVYNDVTREVQQHQPNVGFRFELEQLPGSGTQFDNLELIVKRCHGAMRGR